MFRSNQTVLLSTKILKISFYVFQLFSSWVTKFQPSKINLSITSLKPYTKAKKNNIPFLFHDQISTIATANMTSTYFSQMLHFYSLFPVHPFSTPENIRKPEKKS